MPHDRQERYTEPITGWVQEDTLWALKDRAAVEDRSMSAVVRDAVRAYLRREGKPAPTEVTLPSQRSGKSYRIPRPVGPPRS